MPVQRSEGRDEEFPVPPVTVSPITGIQGAVNWGSLNRFSLASRAVIGDADAHELINWLPQQSCFQQVPNVGPTIATLPGGTAIWTYSDILNGNLFEWVLSTNGHIYQFSVPGGVISDLGAGFSTAPNSCDIVNWQATQILISDFVAQKVYAWNGSVLSTLFSSQPCNFMAVYSGRLWLFKGLVVTWTNAGTNNSFGGDSGSYIVTDGKCANPILGGVDFQGSLYIGGSNWIKTINNLQDTGTPAVLTFQQPTLQSQVSWINKWSIVLYGGNLYFANINGFWVINGSIPNKISTQLDGFFQNIDPVGSSFTGAFGFVYNTPCVFWSLRWLGDGNQTVFGLTDKQLWFRVTPPALSMITGIISSAITNNQSLVLGTDGTNFFNLFGSTTTSVISEFDTKTFDFFSKLTYDLYTNFAMQIFISGATTLTIAELGSDGNVHGPLENPPSGPGQGPLTLSYDPANGGWINMFGVVGQWINGASQTGNWTGGLSAPLYKLVQCKIPFQDRNVAFNVTIVGHQTVLQALVISYRKTETAKG